MDDILSLKVNETTEAHQLLRKHNELIGKHNDLVETVNFFWDELKKLVEMSTQRKKNFDIAVEKLEKEIEEEKGK